MLVVFVLESSRMRLVGFWGLAINFRMPPCRCNFKFLLMYPRVLFRFPVDLFYLWRRFPFCRKYCLRVAKFEGLMAFRKEHYYPIRLRYVWYLLGFSDLAWTPAPSRNATNPRFRTAYPPGFSFR